MSFKHSSNIEVRQVKVNTMTNAYENKMRVNMREEREPCFKPLTFKDVLRVLKRMFR